MPLVEQRLIQGASFISPAIGRQSRNAQRILTNGNRGEESLMARPTRLGGAATSVVVGRSAYGGSALLRGLAALPVLPELPDTPPIQPVHLDDVVGNDCVFSNAKALPRLALDLQVQSRLASLEAVALFRHWLRWRSRVVAPVAAPGRPTCCIGSAMSRERCWPTPISSTAKAEMARGATGDPLPWSQATGLRLAACRTRCSPSPHRCKEPMVRAALRRQTPYPLSCSDCSGSSRVSSRSGPDGAKAWP